MPNTFTTVTLGAPMKLAVKALPMSTSITNMLPAGAVANLSAAAKQLTKSDLVTLQMGGHNDATAALSAADIKGIQAAFAAHGVGPNVAAAGDINCCCCPCCCAATVMRPIEMVA